MNHLVFIGLVVALLGVIVGTVFVTLYVREQKDKVVENSIDLEESVKTIDLKYDPKKVMDIAPFIHTVVLIIANFPSAEEQPNSNYIKCYQRIMKYMTSDPRFYIIFIEFDESLIVPCFYNHRLVMPKGQESVENLYHKTALAMKFVEAHFEYKYMLRTNLSSLWFWDRVYQKMMTFSGTIFAGHKVGEDIISGNGMLMTQNIVQHIISTYGHYNLDDIHDDAIISNTVNAFHPKDKWIHIPYLGYKWDNLNTVSQYMHFYQQRGGDDDQLNQTLCELLWGKDYQPKEIWGKIKQIPLSQ